jgi:hypothetical protein
MAVTTTNPRVAIGNVIPVPSSPTTVRDSFLRIDFSSQFAYTYSDDVDPNIPSELANLKLEGQQNFYFWNMKTVYDKAYSEPLNKIPPFVTDDSWDTVVSKSASCFITSVNSVMPKLIVPSKLLVNNGILDSTQKAKYATVTDTLDNSTRKLVVQGKSLFNWSVSALGNNIPSADQLINCTEVSNGALSIKYKDDTGTDNTTYLNLYEPSDPPTGPWEPAKLVVQGAFCLVLNPVQLSISQPTDNTKKANKFYMEFDFGECVFRLNDSGLLNVNLINNYEQGKVQLTDAKAKESPPQAMSLNNGSPFVIVCYPVWNGIVVSNGIQDSKNSIFISNQYLAKSKDKDISDPSLQTQGKGGKDGTFNTINPVDVFIKVIDDVKVQFGDTLTVATNNCRYEIAYVPLFFSPLALIDTFFVADNDTEISSFEYNAYPIWTDNDTGYKVEYGPVAFVKNIDAANKWVCQSVGLKNTNPNRRAGEIFGMTITTANGNGSFLLNVSGGTPAGTSPIGSIATDIGSELQVSGSCSWQEYIKSISVTTSIDGISGQVVVDKYGLSGQTAVPTQDIGALVIEVTNAPTDGTGNALTGVIFSGLAMGINDAQTVDGGEFNIPLVSLHKKMEDMILINAPFFDGYKMGETTQYLTTYAGINGNWEYASPDVIMPSSTDIAAPMIDFKTGTTIADALTQTMEYTAHTFVVQPDGNIYFYQLNPDDGLPVVLGKDWSSYYPDTKIMTIDKIPDFEDMRNEIIATAMQPVKNANRDSQQEIQLVPNIIAEDIVTTPTFAWTKSMFYGVPGYLTMDELQTVVDRNAMRAKRYLLSGRTTIAGNAEIRPYDKWGDLVITSVTQNIDLQGKTWTTDLEFYRGRA